MDFNLSSIGFLLLLGIVRHIKGKGWAVFSEKTGKKLSRFYSSKEEAVKRLRVIEMFKHMTGKK